jgi:hypothetical protein
VRLFRMGFGSKADVGEMDGVPDNPEARVPGYYKKLNAGITARPSSHRRAAASRIASATRGGHKYFPDYVR